MTSGEVCKPSASNIFAAEMHTPSSINSRFALEALPSGMLQEDFTYFGALSGTMRQRLVVLPGYLEKDCLDWKLRRPVPE